MRLIRRREDPVATYAVVVADRWLWLAAPEPLDVTLEGADLASLREQQPGHHGVRLDLAGLPEREDRYAVLAGGRPLAGSPASPSGPGTRHALERDGAGRLHVSRRVLAAGATLASARLLGDTVALRLDGAVARVELVDGDRGVGLDGGGAAWTIRLEHLAGLTPGAVLRVRADGRPVVRRANTLADPGAGALLPAVHPEGAELPLGRLRWAPDATLVVRVPSR